MKQSTFRHLLTGLLTVIAGLALSVGAHASPSCGNDSANVAGKGGPGNPRVGNIVVYTGNEFRAVPDIAVWGGVGEWPLVFQRYGNSRFVGGQNYFGDGHNWRHSYQWEMADAAPTSSGQAQVEIIYPEGDDNTFTRKTATATTWYPAKSVEDLLYQSGTDFYLQRKNGFRYHFTKNVNGSGNTYYLMTDFKDSIQNDYVLTYNSAHQVTQITEPGGRNLQINYTTVSLNKVDFTTFASVAGLVANGNPPENQWTEITVTDPTAYRYLRYVSPDTGHCDVAEVEFYDTLGNKLTGTPYGVSPSVSASTDYTKAFDGNVSTYVDLTQQSGGYTGIDLGAGNTAVIGKVRFYPRSGFAHLMNGYDWWTTSGHGQFQGSNQAPSPLTVISSVTTNDGRTVTYNYAPFNDPNVPYVYQTLSSVTYDDGNQATYTYGQVYPATRPLVTAFNDPRYAGKESQTGAVYWTEVASALGAVQKHTIVIGGVPSTIFGIDSTGIHTPTVQYADGVETYNMSVGQLASKVDTQGNKTSYTYTSNGFPKTITPPTGGSIGLNPSPYNNPLTTTLPNGTTEVFTRNTYDASTVFRDASGGITNWVRDGSNQVTKITTPDGSSTTITNNGYGQPVGYILPSGATLSNAYDLTGLKISTTDAVGYVTNYTYDSAGRLASVTDPRGNLTSYQYDSKGETTLVTNADGSNHAYFYDIFGNQTSDADELGHTTSDAYDQLHRITSVTDADGRAWQFKYANASSTKPSLIILPSGKTLACSYISAAQENLTLTNVANGTIDQAITHYTYDSSYNLSSVVDPLGHMSLFTYDNLNRKISTTDSIGNKTTYAYDANNDVLTVSRPDGGVTTKVYDSMKRLIKAANPKGEVTQFTYDTTGNLLTTTDANHNTYTFTYDAMNRKTSLQYPNGTMERYSYDGFGNMVGYSTRSGQIESLVYNNRNQLTSTTWSDATLSETFTYDVSGKLIAATNNGCNIIYAYDSANQLTSISQTNLATGGVWVIAYGYDIDGNRNSVTYPSSKVVTYSFTNRNQCNQISLDGAVVATYRYDADGNIVNKNLVDGSSANYTYDDKNRLTTLIHSLGGTTFARFDYGYDNVDRSTFEQRDGGTGDAYSYDADDQLNTVQYDAPNPNGLPTNGDRTVSYVYDSSGNRSSTTDSVLGNTNFTVGNLNQYLTSNATNFSYDSNGNLTNGIGIYSYDALNRLITSQSGSNSDQFRYDSSNRVVRRIVNGYAMYLIYDGWNLIEERDSANNLLATYVHGVQQDEMLTKTDSARTVYYHQNGLGSVINLTDSSGSIVEKYKYDVDGKTFFYDVSGNAITGTAFGNRFLFAGREYLSAINLYDCRNRMYSADIGRFLQTDPLRFASGDSNLYRYAGNSSTNRTDPSGMYWVYLNAYASNVLIWKDPVTGLIGPGPTNPAPSTVTAATITSADGRTHYNQSDTQAIINQSLLDAQRSPFSLGRIMDLFFDHVIFGSKYDPAANPLTTNNTYIVNGKEMSADQFGNYLAGYDAQGALGYSGGQAAMIAAYADSAFDIATGDHSEFDFSQTPLRTGINNSSTFRMQSMQSMNFGK